MNDGDSHPDRSTPSPDFDPAPGSEPESDPSRRGFLQGGLLTVGAGTLAAIGAPALAHAQTAVPRTTLNHFQVAASDKTVHWGYFSKNLKPVVETEYVVHGFSFPNYLADLGPKAQSEIYSKSSTDLALRDAFRKMRRFLMTTQHLNEDEAVSLMSIAVDFGITQVVDGNWGIHAIVKKSLFAAG
jgi:acetamidase/formamidase